MKKAVCRKYDLSINRCYAIWCAQLVPEFPVWFCIKSPKSILRDGFDKVICKINYWEILNILVDQYKVIFFSVNCIVASQKNLNILIYTMLWYIYSENITGLTVLQFNFISTRLCFKKINADNSTYMYFQWSEKYHYNKTQKKRKGWHQLFIIKIHFYMSTLPFKSFGLNNIFFL